MNLQHEIESTQTYKYGYEKIELLMYFNDSLFWRFNWTPISGLIQDDVSCEIGCPQHVIDQANRIIEDMREDFQEEEQYNEWNETEIFGDYY